MHVGTTLPHGLFGSLPAPSFRKSASVAGPNGSAPGSWLPGSQQYSRTKTWSCCFGHPRIGNPGVGLIYVQMPPSSDLRDAYRFAAFSLPSHVTFYSPDEATWRHDYLSFRIGPSPATLLQRPTGPKATLSIEPAGL